MSSNAPPAHIAPPGNDIWQLSWNPSPILPYTEQTAYEHARVRAALEAAGKRIGAHDLIVAATALERHDQVATFNARHFAQVPSLRILQPASHSGPVTLAASAAPRPFFGGALALS